MPRRNTLTLIGCPAAMPALICKPLSPSTPRPLRALQGLRAGSVAMAAALALGGCGGGGGGPAIDALPQTLSFGTAPALSLGGTATVTASASSGLAVTFSSLTPSICSVGASSGVVTAQAAGDCIIAANQEGNSHYAPAATATQTLPVQAAREQTLSFTLLPTLAQYDSATVVATASSGLPVSYSSSTPLVCQIDASSGLITALAVGNCSIFASQPGDASHDAATPISSTLVVGPATGTVTVPGAPQGVSATLGSTDSNVVVSSTGLSATGGSAITGYAVHSVPAGLSATSASLPVTVTCPSGCAGYAFTLTARNVVGSGSASAAADLLTAFDVTATFREPDTQPNDTIFVGTFTLNSTTRTVSGLTGTLTESMTGSFDGKTPMTLIDLRHQLSSVGNGTGGLLVTSFALNTVHTFSPSGFADTVNGIYYGYPAAWSPATANSFVTIDVDPDQPTRTLNQAQATRLTYGDCALGGMMGAACMTGNASGGTMGGYPVSQVVTRRTK
jgi:hypothetical protein